MTTMRNWELIGLWSSRGWFNFKTSLRKNVTRTGCNTRRVWLSCRCRTCSRYLMKHFDHMTSQVLEEEVVEAHRNMLDGLEVWRQQDATLIAMTNEVDYDQEAYAQLLEEMVKEKQEVLTNLAERARAFR